MSKTTAHKSVQQSSASAHTDHHPAGKGIALPAQTSLQPVQMLTVNKLGNYASPSWDFTVLKADLNHGTGTSQGTRNYVNDPVSWPNVAGTVNYSYDIFDLHNTLVDSDSGSAPNPPDHKARNWDAGHTLGNQNGGLGDVNAWVFPQNPSFNRGNNHFGAKTYHDWRYCENEFHKAVHANGKGRWKVWLT